MAFVMCQPPVLCQRPVMTKAHRIMGWAAACGVLYSISHTVSFMARFWGPGWPGWGNGLALYYLEMVGYVTGVIFTMLCWTSSSKRSDLGRHSNRLICAWAVAIGGVRLVVSPMILGIVDVPAVYPTPDGAVQITSIISEVLIGNVYSITAFVSSLMLLARPEDLVLPKPGGVQKE